MDWSIFFSKNYIIYTVFSIIILLLFIWNLIISIQLSRLKTKYKHFMRGATNISIEQMIKEYMQSIDNTVNKVDIISNDLLNLKDQTDRCIQKCNIIRYNAFSNTGSDLSYSIALLDNYNTGVILSSIYGREESVTYAKPVDNGNSRYPLSVEEEMVLNRGLKTVI